MPRLTAHGLHGWAPRLAPPEEVKQEAKAWTIAVVCEWYLPQ